MSAMEGRITAVAWEDGKRKDECELEDCPCPTHEEAPRPPGTYITVRLPEDTPVGPWKVIVTRQEGDHR